MTYAAKNWSVHAMNAVSQLQGVFSINRVADVPMQNRSQKWNVGYKVVHGVKSGVPPTYLALIVKRTS